MTKVAPLADSGKQTGTGASSVRVVATPAERRRFVNYPYERNRRDPHWIPPLRMSERERLSPRHNPFFAHAAIELLLAWRDGRIVGRIAAIDDALHNETHRGDNLAMFGFFEAEDAESAGALLGAVERWAAARGRVAVRGPLNPSLNESAGLLVDGFDTDSMLLMPHNPPEYASYIEGAGYAKVKDLYAWIYDLDRTVDPDIVRLAERVRTRYGITMRPLELKEFQREVEWLREVYCGAWEQNWGFVPPTREEFQRLARELKPIFDPRGAVIAEMNGRPIACVIAVPDINQALRGTDGRLFPWGLVRLLARARIIDQGRLLLLGILREFRGYGLYPLLMLELQRQVRGSRYRRVEFSWVLEDNRDVNEPAARIGAERYKTYRIYQKTL
jgi:GNAT superfamily N-acetyltransferase